MALSTVTIVLIILGCIIFILMTISIIVWILWNRRKLKFARFLNNTGTWEIKSYKVMNKEIEYDGEIYQYELDKCTRDKHNRPVAYYYKGNPKQMVFDIKNMANKSIMIGTEVINGKDFMAMMLTKIVKDIFADDDMLIWLIIIGAIMIIGFIVLGILVATHNPDVTLSKESLQAISDIIRPPIKAITRT